MPNLNHVVIAGHLTRTPEIKYANSGTTITEFGIATNSGTKERPETFFGECVCFGGWADNLAKRGDKGLPILISGRSQSNGKGRQKRSKTRISAIPQLLHLGISHRTAAGTAGKRRNGDILKRKYRQLCQRKTRLRMICHSKGKMVDEKNIKRTCVIHLLRMWCAYRWRILTM